MPPRSRVEDPSAQARAAVAQRTSTPARNAGRPIRDRIQSLEASFQMAMPRGREAEQLIRDALTCLNVTPKLEKCEQSTVLGALMTCAQLGLRPGVLGQAWLIPFYDKRAGIQKAQLIIGYQGYAELAHRTGQIGSLIARPVHSNDVFDVDFGLADRLVHKPLLTGDRGPITAYYSIIKYVSGGHAFHVMGRSDVERHRDRFAMARDREGQVIGPWVDHFDAMALKTVFLQLMRWAPKSPELVSAMGADGSVRTDIALDAMPIVRDDVIEGETVEEPADNSPAEPAETGPAEPTPEDIAAMNAEAAGEQ